MKFKIYEKVLVECVGASDVRLLTELDASSLDEAIQKSKVMFPNSFLNIHDVEKEQYYVFNS